jgi:hypothetical protein
MRENTHPDGIFCARLIITNNILIILMDIKYYNKSSVYMYGKDNLNYITLKIMPFLLMIPAYQTN